GSTPCSPRPSAATSLRARECVPHRPATGPAAAHGSFAAVPPTPSSQPELALAREAGAPAARSIFAPAFPSETGQEEELTPAGVPPPQILPLRQPPQCPPRTRDTKQSSCLSVLQRPW